MGKRMWHFERVAEFKQRFRGIPSQTLRDRLNGGMLEKEAAIALRELLDERERELQASRTSSAD